MVAEHQVPSSGAGQPAESTATTAAHPARRRRTRAGTEEAAADATRGHAPVRDTQVEEELQEGSAWLTKQLADMHVPWYN